MLTKLTVHNVYGFECRQPEVDVRFTELINSTWTVREMYNLAFYLSKDFPKAFEEMQAC